ncbi:hypothetical protein CRM22_002104, partial [Opisthorchis felineus]
MFTPFVFVILVGAVFSRVVELDIKTLAPNGLLQDVHPCKTVSLLVTFEGLVFLIRLRFLKFILVAPFDDEFCQKIINKKFYEEQLNVKDCNLLEKSDVQVDGHILGKYNVTLLEKQTHLAPFEYHDIYIFFLRELNGPEGACDHNGYWARPLFNCKSAYSNKSWRRNLNLHLTRPL